MDEEEFTSSKIKKAFSEDKNDDGLDNLLKSCKLLSSNNFV